MRLNTIIRQNYNKYRHRLDLPNEKIYFLFQREKVKSKNFRLCLSNKPPQLSSIKTTINRYLWTNTHPIDILRETRWIKVWNLSFLTLDIRDFSFKMINNKLNFNASLANFYESVQNSACSFCTL